MFSRNNVKIATGAIVCEESKLRGDIIVGANTIIHPCAVINAESGPIIIGDNCLIEEQVQINHRLPFDKKQDDKENVLIIGSNNVFEVNCIIEAQSIGNNNIFESKCFVGKKVKVPNGCTIGAGCQLLEGGILTNNTIVYGSHCIKRVTINPPQLPVLQMDVLSKVLPNYHYIRKPNKK